MNRPALITLRILAIGSALTVLGCLVANNQKNANASARGDRGQPGPAAPAANAQPQSPPTWASSSKSLSPLVRTQDLPSSGQGYQQVTPSGTPAAEPPRRFMGGSKSAAVVRPSDVRGHQAPAAAATTTTGAKEEATRLVSRGQGFYSQGLYNDAAGEFARAIALDPDNAAAKSGLERCKTAPASPAPAPVNAPVSPRRFAPGSKSGAPMSADDVRQLRQSANPPAQQAAPKQQ